MTFTKEDLQAAVHDCSGKSVVPEEISVQGWGAKGLPVSDTLSKTCYARMVVNSSDIAKNEYFIALNKDGGLFIPFETTDQGRSEWIKCSYQQMEMYLNMLKTGITFDARTLRDQLRIN
jgi:hypothetical protein